MKDERLVVLATPYLNASDFKRQPFLEEKLDHDLGEDYFNYFKYVKDDCQLGITFMWSPTDWRDFRPIWKTNTTHRLHQRTLLHGLRSQADLQTVSSGHSCLHCACVVVLSVFCRPLCRTGLFVLVLYLLAIY